MLLPTPHHTTPHHTNPRWKHGSDLAITPTNEEENNDSKEIFGRKWSYYFGYLSQAKCATGFDLDRGFSSF